MQKKHTHMKTLLAVLFIILSHGSAVFAAEHMDASLYIMRLMNDARSNPEDALFEIGIDKTAAQASLGTDAWVLDQGLLPLAWNNKLFNSALAHANDMITKLYYSFTSQNGNTVEDRIKATGYNPMSAGEGLAILSFNQYIEPTDAAVTIFNNILDFEMGSAVSQDSRNILSEDRTEVGIAVVSAVVDLGFNIPMNMYLVVADFSTPVSPQSFIIGNVSTKTMDYPEYKLENALTNVNIKLRELSTKKETIVKPSQTGFFQFSQPFGFLLLEVWDEANTTLLDRKSIFGQNQNVFKDIFIDK